MKLTVSASKRTKIKQLLDDSEIGQKAIVKGWVRTFRNNKFIAINDGSTIQNLQAVVNPDNMDESLLKRLTTSACVAVSGTIKESLGKGQRVELEVEELELIGDANVDEYQLQPKRHSLEFLRSKAHLRVRTNTFGAVYRIRHAMIFAVHNFFTE
ncbi:MAG: OB-fold nucleic acid binding domain-containing protein, partial [Bacteroidota bacterium]